MIEVKEWTFDKAREAVRSNREALVFLGTSDYQSWVIGVNAALHEAEILDLGEFLDEVYHLQSTGGRNDLAFMIDTKRIEIGKLAMWRLQFGSVSWLSDFVVNYADHYGQKVEVEDDEPANLLEKE